jgi:membrane protein
MRFASAKGYPSNPMVTSRNTSKVCYAARTTWNLAIQTIDEFSRDRGDLVAAALAFYALLSIAPMIIIAVAIAGAVLGEGNARHEVQELLRTAMQKDAAVAVDGWVQQASNAGGFASIVGVVLTLLAASRFVAQLRSALNQIWNVDVDVADSFKASIKGYVARRLFAFGLILTAGPILLAIFASRAIVMGLGKALLPDTAFTGFGMETLQLSLSVTIVGVLGAVIFRVMPDTRVPWRAACWGAGLTSVLFNVGNLLVGWYLGKAAVGATYGAAGSVVVVLIWFYLSAHTFLLGAEFTQVYSRRVSAGPDE